MVESEPGRAVNAFSQNGLSMRRLRRGAYQELDSSEVFPGVSAKAISQLMEQGKSLGRTGWLRLTRGWARKRYGKSSA